jgi:hypothetical protein
MPIHKIYHLHPLALLPLFVPFLLLPKCFVFSLFLLFLFSQNGTNFRTGEGLKIGEIEELLLELGLF